MAINKAFTTNMEYNSIENDDSIIRYLYQYFINDIYVYM